MRELDLVPLGAPGVYFVPERPPPTALGVPMDECAFVGVAPRGPAWEWVEGDDGPERTQAVSVAVRSFDDYRRRFGGFDGPGLLPLAVSAFFEQGGRVAHVVRVVSRRRGTPPALEPEGRALLDFDAHVATTGGGPVSLAARNEGTWGERLSATLSFSATELPLPDPAAALVGRELTTGVAPLAVGAVLRVTTDDGVRRIRVVETSLHMGLPREFVALLDLPVAGTVTMVELVEAVLDVVDGDPDLLRQERFDHLGLLPAHPRWLGDVVRRQSALVEPLLADGDGIVPGVDLKPSATAVREDTAADRYAPIDATDVVDAGVAVAVAVPEAALVCVPDLYAPTELPDLVDVVPPASTAGAEFAPCHPVQAVRAPSIAPPPALPNLRLDPTVAAELEEIVRLQAEVVRRAEAARMVALLDVPPGLRVAAVQRWRRRFQSSYAAGYHPWLLVPRDGIGGAGRLVAVPPSSVAAGIIARTEARWGIPRGPGNEVAKDVPHLTTRIVEPEHGDLHWANVNAFVMGPQGVVLVGARTLSTERMWRQLTARRVVSMVERAVAAQLQWVVFEPNTATLRTAVATTVETLLFELFRAGAFSGASPAECFFVRTSTGPALAAEQDGGQLLCEIGLAPTEPMEFLLVRVYREGDATVRAESGRA